MAATIKDIAKRTGLGLATISSFINGGNVREANKIKIEEAIQELHFEVNEVARGLKTNKTKTIGVVIPELSNVFCTEIISRMEDILRKHGYAAIVCDCRTNVDLEKEVVDFLYKKRVDGIINMPVNVDGSHLLAFQRSKKPIVLIDRKINRLLCDCALVDNLTAAKNGVQVLLNNGHTNIGIISGPEHIFTAQERLFGYKLALMEAGLTPRDQLIAYSDYSIHSGALCLEELVRRNKDMTAVFVTNYETTMGAVIGMNELSLKFPEDLSIIGFDSIEFARAVSPKLTIISQPTNDIAEGAAGMMLERLDGLLCDGRIQTFQTKIVHGKSVRSI